MKHKTLLVLFAALIAALTAGCVAPQIDLFTDATDPLKSYTLSGTGEKKVLLIPVKGIISDKAEDDMLRSRPGMVQEIVAQLDKAKDDPNIRAVLFKINSPGGSVTASDILYNEINQFKKDTDVKVLASMMNVAASGGYYIALPADHIMAHPTTITGSVGVIFIRPDITGLMDKIGVSVAVDTSGENKDMGSPFRKSSETEQQIFEDLIDSLGRQFIRRIETHRQLSAQEIESVATARIFLAEDALEKGLIDEIGYLPEAIDKAKQMAGIDEDSRVVVYRRSEFPDDNIYNSLQMREGRRTPLVDLGLPPELTRHLTGFYYLWHPGLGEK